MNILTIGDVVGAVGCEFLRQHLPAFKKLKQIDFVVANGENSANGNGITPVSAEHLLASGVDVITTGNHVYRRKEVYPLLDEADIPIIRPANFPASNPGRGCYIADKGRVQIGVLNLMGSVYLQIPRSPFDCIDELLAQVSGCRIVLLDFHAETTSEKRAMGFYLDGRISALFGTHTHVQTADEQILPQGTGYITDLGMTGPLHSVLGVKPEIIIAKMKSEMPMRFDTADPPAFLSGCIFSVDEQSGKTTAVERVLLQ